jgi:hypothetical protein
MHIETVKEFARLDLCKLIIAYEIAKTPEEINSAYENLKLNVHRLLPLLVDLPGTQEKAVVP